MRYILLSFLFMAWGFYELSGGSDFDPDAVREARMAKLEMEAAAPEAAPDVEEVAQATAVTPEPAADVTRVALNLTTLENAVSDPAVVTTTPLAQDAPEAIDEIQNDVAAAVEAAISDQNVVTTTTSLVTSSVDTPAILPSLIDPDASLSAADSAVEVAALEDIRTVSGNRVNVRGGPGTDFGVVGRLVRGDEIKVLEDNGAGWVRFETTDGITAGWMADFLLTSG